jgi:hypothetical protein
VPRTPRPWFSGRRPVGRPDPGELPPVRTRVELALGDGTVLSTRILAREGAAQAVRDYLDAPRSPAGVATTGFLTPQEPVVLSWGHEDWVDQFPVAVTEVMDPLPALEVLYLGPGRRVNRRAVARSSAHVRVRLRRLDDGVPRGWFQSVTRDISPAGARVFFPAPMAPGTVLAAEFTLDESPAFAATLKVRRLSSEPSEYRGYEGTDAVIVFDPVLTGADEARWSLYCRRHRWDY